MNNVIVPQIRNSLKSTHDQGSLLTPRGTFIVRFSQFSHLTLLPCGHSSLGLSLLAKAGTHSHSRMACPDRPSRCVPANGAECGQRPCLAVVKPPAPGSDYSLK